MTRCDNCDSEVTHVWKHREYDESMTHREVEWLCADCHPAMSSEIKNAPN